MALYRTLYRYVYCIKYRSVNYKLYVHCTVLYHMYVIGVVYRKKNRRWSTTVMYVRVHGLE